MDCSNSALSDMDTDQLLMYCINRMSSELEFELAARLSIAMDIIRSDQEQLLQH